MLVQRGHIAPASAQLRSLRPGRRVTSLLFPPCTPASPLLLVLTKPGAAVLQPYWSTWTIVGGGGPHVSTYSNALARKTELLQKGCRMLYGFLLIRSHGSALVGFFGAVLKELLSLGCDGGKCRPAASCWASISIRWHMIISVFHCLILSHSRTNRISFPAKCSFR